MAEEARLQKLYTKLYDKYKAMKEKKDSVMEELNQDQETKFRSFVEEYYVAANDGKVDGELSNEPTVAAIEAGIDIVLANKETLIAGGPFGLPLAHKHNVKILPADSEHSAIFQCI